MVGANKIICGKLDFFFTSTYLHEVKFWVSVKKCFCLIDFVAFRVQLTFGNTQRN
jgi:hypothetical protein